MQNEFKFKIKNFGPIDEANLNLNKLNVIGGVNASGKSFSARLLFCIITALSDEGKRIEVALRHAKVIDDNLKDLSILSDVNKIISKE